MAVYTHKEYSEKQAEAQGLPEPTKKQRLTSLIDPASPKSVQERTLYEYYLLHPENGADGDLQEFEDIVNVYGTEYKRVCKRGIVKTKEKDLADYLLDRGYLLMEKIEVE